MSGASHAHTGAIYSATRWRAGGPKVRRIPTSNVHRAPIITLFLIWRLHGKPRHGYLLVKDMKELAVKPVKPSTVYALLVKMESAGLVKSHVDSGGRHIRRLYSTTAKGWKVLQWIKKNKIKGLWREFMASMLS